MRILLSLLFILSFPLWADTKITSQIHEIDYGTNQDDETLVLLTSGDVIRVDQEEAALLKIMQEGIKERRWFSIHLDQQRKIRKIKEVLSPKKKFSSGFQKSLFEETSPYIPTVLKDLDEARSFFYDVRTNPKESQCYNRAHAWAYDWRTKRSLYSSKAWLYFTKRYIRKYKFDWWFHVAPMVHVVIDGEVKERVMDMKYARGPLKLKTWTDIFMRDGSHCPVVEKYSDQANYPESGSCFTMKSSMYYYQPVDLEQLETTGTEKTRWVESEVKNAFLDALEITL